VPCIYGAITGAIVSYAGYKLNHAFNKETEVYAPDRPLPQTEDGVPIPDSDRPHTQLGTETSKRNYKYPQAREFGENGKPIRDIDFTDHRRKDHTNPHQHRHIPNKTGGTPQRDDAEPVPGWKY
jgi:hypothetical protein